MQTIKTAPIVSVPLPWFYFIFSTTTFILKQTDKRIATTPATITTTSFLVSSTFFVVFLMCQWSKVVNCFFDCHTVWEIIIQTTSFTFLQDLIGSNALNLSSKYFLMYAELIRNKMHGRKNSQLCKIILNLE